MSRNGFESEKEGRASGQAVRCLPTYQPMVLVFCALAIGIVGDRTLDLPAWSYVIVALLAFATWLVLFKGRIVKQNRSCDYFRIGLASCLLSLGIGATGAFWHHGYWNWIGPANIVVYSGKQSQPVCLDAVVTSEPSWQAVADDERELNAIPRVDRTRVTIRPIQIREGMKWSRVSGKIDLVIHERCEHIRSGDRIRIFGSLVAINGPTNPGQFDFRNFYRSDGKGASVHAMRAEAVCVNESVKNWSRSSLLYVLRKKLNEITWRYVPPERAALASAVLLGNREQLTSSRRDLFLMTGTVHLLAISGLHVGILSGVFFFFYRVGLIRRTTFLWATILFVCFYCWLVEFRAPVSRATILIVLLCIGRLKGHPILSFNWLAAAACAVLAINPTDLFQLGPQLSFLAVATITFGRSWLFWPPPSDPLKRLIANTRPFHVRLFYWMGRQTRSAFLVSGLIWLVAMPLVAFRFNLVAPVALLVNPILLLPIAFSLYGGLAVLVFGWFSTPIAAICGMLCGWGLGLIESLIAVANGIPLSHYWTSGPTTVSLVLFYVGVFFLAVFPRTRVSAKWFLLAIWLWLVFGWWVPDALQGIRERQIQRDLAVTFIDVGHGTGVLIELPDGRNMLYDAGSFGSSTYGARNISSVLWHHRIEHLDAIVLSHADVDHFNAIPELCEKFSVGVVYMSSVMREDNFPTIKRLNDLLREQDVRIETLATGDRLRSNQCNIEILSPPFFGTGGSDNSNSVVVMVNYRNRKILLTGDLESNGMELLLSQSPVDVDVLMAPHHGSLNSSPAKLTSWCQPKAVVISGSQKRISANVETIFGHSGAQIYRTDRDGAVRFDICESGIKVTPFNPNRVALNAQTGDLQKAVMR